MHNGSENKKEHDGKGLHFCGVELWISKDCEAKSMKFSEDPTMKVKENVMKHDQMSGTDIVMNDVMLCVGARCTHKILYDIYVSKSKRYYSLYHKFARMYP
jgi:hypothetical protein